MTGGQALLQACRAEPEDDAPRLVYADWLDEHGEPERAEFIRVQCQLACLEAQDPRRPRLELRELELLRDHRAAWLDGLPRWEGVAWKFRRGLIAEALVTPESFLRHAATLFRAAPVHALHIAAGVSPGGEQMRLADGEYLIYPDLDDLKKACQRRALGQVSALTIDTGGLGAEGAAILAGCQHFTGLRWLRLHDCGLGPAGAAALARAPWLKQLSYLSLGHNKIAAEGLAALLAVPWERLAELDLEVNTLDDAAMIDLAGRPAMRHLRRLEAGRNAVGDAGVLALAGSRHLRGLTSLDLGDHPRVRLPSAEAIAASRHLKKLQRLHLGRTKIGDGGVRALAGSPNLSALELLGLREVGLKAAGVEALARSPHLARLRALDVGFNKLGGKAASALAAADWPRLRALDLSGTGLDGKAAAAILGSAGLPALEDLCLFNNDRPTLLKGLVRSPSLARLRALDVSHLEIDAARAGLLAECPHAPPLAVLSLSFNRFGDAGLARLAGSPLLRHVRRLELGFCAIGDAGAAALAGSPHAAGLVALDLHGNTIGPEGAKALASSPHLANLARLDVSSNELRDAGGRALRASPYLRRLLRLDLSMNGLSSDSVDAT